MKNTNKKLKKQSKVVKASFTDCNKTKYSGLNTGKAIPTVTVTRNSATTWVST